jgi:hypothetical protein
LRLSVNNTGLRYEIDPPPNSSFANDLMISISRGDISNSSFGFICTDDVWREDQNGQIVRTVLNATLFDVSPVTFPAYPDATVGVRTIALRNAPSEIRAKLRDIADGQIDSDDDADDEDGCGCDCDQCEDGDCADCSNEDCEDDRCERCAQQTRAAYLAIIKRKLRS